MQNKMNERQIIQRNIFKQKVCGIFYIFRNMKLKYINLISIDAVCKIKVLNRNVP